MQCSSLRVVEVIALVVDDKIEDCAVRQLSLFVDDKTSVAYGGA